MKIEYSYFKKYSTESALFINRTLVAFLGILFLTGILLINLYYLQITCFKYYYALSTDNCIKLIPIVPIRGIIYDRNKIPLAINRIVYQLELIPSKIDNLQKTIADLRLIVDLTDDDINLFKKKYKYSRRFVPLILKANLNEAQQARFAVNQHRFPGIEIKKYYHRYYPYGTSFTHVIGYVSKINDIDLKYLNNNGILHNYKATDNIGKFGIERYYEKILHGKTGYAQIEVNNTGQIVRQLYEQPPQAGKDIVLTLDFNLQQYIEKLLIGSRAAVIVLDPRDSSIRAMVSSPSYDPNLFVDGISNKDFHALLKDKNRPLINRATQGIYPPASTVKPYISISALTLGIINKNFLLFDPGWWQLPGSNKCYRDWKRLGHGQLNVTKALEESADTFFYQIAFDMGINRLSEWMMKFGYGQYTGIDLSEESIGVMPTREWKMLRFKKPWYQGDTISVGIGQGYWTATPIQMSKILITLINDGIVRKPHLLQNILEYGHPIPYYPSKHMQIGNPNSGFWEIVKDGMYGVANRPNGTANKIFSDAPYKIAAKSGTAQLYRLKNNENYDAQKISEHLRDHKLMTAFAPFNKPTVAVVVILENGGSGFTVGHITRQILDYILLKKSH